MTFKNLLLAACLAALFAGCTNGARDIDPNRGPLAKADNLGSCVDTTCDGPAPGGNCWCDSMCSFYGDCCDDKVAVCDVDENACGGLVGLTCNSDEYCHYEQNAQCGAADQMGTCLEIPEACIEIFAPVCGCDGVTYSNSCFANMAGTSALHDGACDDGQEKLCMTIESCDAGEYCDTSECHMPPCPPGMACPQVCYGACTPAEICGGFAGLPCPDSETCVDDPNDSCDPMNGGADCSGICVECPPVVCTLACDEFQTGPDGCPICACVVPDDCTDAGGVCLFNGPSCANGGDNLGLSCPGPNEMCCSEPGPSASCEDACGGQGSGGCWCDDLCAGYGDCCEDYNDFCGAARTPVSGSCIRNSNDECQTDSDCTAGGCGGELCFNPAESNGASTCDCTAPGPDQVTGCGCVNGSCTWWN